MAYEKKKQGNKYSSTDERRRRGSKLNQYINSHGDTVLSSVGLSDIPEAIQATRFFRYHEWNSMYNWMKANNQWPTTENVRRYIAGLLNYEEYRELQKKKGLWQSPEDHDGLLLRASLEATSKKTRPQEFRHRLSRGLGTVQYSAVVGTRDTDFDGPDCQPDGDDDPFARR